jgi:hypothetical protein
MHFNSFAKTFHSQYGEDGIIEEIIRRLDGDRSAGRYCVDVGAWDGRFFSNFPQDSVYKVNARVTWEGEPGLDRILSRAGVPLRFDFLSIDVDGVDYHILESLRQYWPALICVEFNPSIPNAVDYVQPRDVEVTRGSSIRALARLGAQKGYAVVAATHCNLFLLDRASLGTVGVDRDPTLDEIRDDSQVRTYVFCGYDGQVLLSQPVSCPSCFDGFPPTITSPSELLHQPSGNSGGGSSADL